MPKNKVSSKQEILDVAEKLFVRYGYHDTDMRRTARECGIAVGTLYNYFPDKRSLFDAVYDKVLTATLTQVNQVIAKDQPARIMLYGILEQVYFSTINYLSLWVARYALDLQRSFLIESHKIDEPGRMPGLDPLLVEKVENIVTELLAATHTQMPDHNEQRITRILLDSISICYLVDPGNDARNIAFLHWLVDTLCGESPIS